jgi:thymidylate synthase ThyX
MQVPKVTYVALRPTEAAQAAGRPALTPELLAATGARYSRNGEGLDAILAKIDFGNERETLQRLLNTIEWADPAHEDAELLIHDLQRIRLEYQPGNLDQGVDSIFNMIDYGHASIADMAPVAMFLDNLSIHLIYWIFSQCPTGSGQETSTRYVQFDREGAHSSDLLGIPSFLKEDWYHLMDRCFAAYQEAYGLWLQVFEEDPTVAQVPADLLRQADRGSARARKEVERMQRNYAFDRARYWLPVAAQSNMMLLMSARGWVELIQKLLSHPWPEAQLVGGLLHGELSFATPRLLRHAIAKQYWKDGFQDEQARIQFAPPGDNHLENPALSPEYPSTPFLEIMEPQIGSQKYLLEEYARDLKCHPNRYAHIGPYLRRTGVRYGWYGMAMAELRDLNRQRPGNKHWTPIPQGFYWADDQVPEGKPELRARLRELAEIGRESGYRTLAYARGGDPNYLYWGTLGLQYPFEHLTTGDKAIYTLELRTGKGVHFRYAHQCREILQLLYGRYPSLKGRILEGAGEPE